MSILGFEQAVNPLFTILPLVLMISSGYVAGIIISKIRRKAATSQPRDFIYGTITVNFLFLSGFVIFGVLSFSVNVFFTAFTYILVALTLICAYILLKKLVTFVIRSQSFFHQRQGANLKIADRFWLTFSDNKTSFILTGIFFVASALSFQATIIYYHPIYSEYDSIYRFLPVTKSILLGNGLNHDFFLGSDINIRHPPFVQAIDSWLVQSFEYSSVRLFPFYFVLISAVSVYSLSRNILINTTNKMNSTFLSLIAATAFSITPALLVVSSRFSLQQDLAFVFILSLAFYLLSEIVKSTKPARTTLLILSATLSIMSLTREIGLVIAIGFFFLVPAIKYTEHNLKLRALFTILAFIPFYILSVKDILEIGPTFVTTIRIVVLLFVNLVTFYLLYHQKPQNNFTSLISPLSNFKYVAPIIIPTIFIGINLVLFTGPFPVFTFSGEFSQMFPAFREIFKIPNHLMLNIVQALENLPRIDILFVSLAMGSIFVFFKLIGFGKIIYHVKSNSQYSLILILLVFLLFAWSYLLQSRFEGSDIRYVVYFVPLLSIILVIGINLKNVSSQANMIYCCAFIILATFYFFHFNLYVWNYNDHFGGFWIEPKIHSIMNLEDYRFAAVVSAGLLILALARERISSFVDKYHLHRFTVMVLIALICIQGYNLSNSGIILASPEKLNIPPSDWESHVMEIINYLNNSTDHGNVLSVRAPAIPFFTNRTNFDIFSPQTYAYTISPLLSTGNSTAFKEKIESMGIKYIVVPKESTSLYYLVKNSTLDSTLIPIINNIKEYDKIEFTDYNLYKDKS